MQGFVDAELKSQAVAPVAPPEQDDSWRFQELGTRQFGQDSVSPAVVAPAAVAPAVVAPANVVDSIGGDHEDDEDEGEEEDEEERREAAAAAAKQGRGHKRKADV